MKSIVKSKNLAFRKVNSVGKGFWPYVVDLAGSHYGHESKSYRRKFYVRCLMHLNAVKDMLTILNHVGLPEKSIADIVSKIRKGYLYKGASTNQRCRLIMQNYQILHNVLPENTLANIVKGNSVHLCQLSIENDPAPLRVELVCEPGDCSQEGEMLVNIRREDDSLVYRMAFTLANIAGRPSLIIGCVQGGAPGNDVCLSDGRSLTRKYHGIRPKVMLIPVLQALAGQLGCKQLLGVTSDHQYYKTTNRRKNMVGFDYDGYWKELDAVPFSSVFVKLPIEAERKPLEDIATKKRGMYRKRYALLDRLSEEVLSSLH